MTHQPDQMEIQHNQENSGTSSSLIHYPHPTPSGQPHFRQSWEQPELPMHSPSSPQPHARLSERETSSALTGLDPLGKKRRGEPLNHHTSPAPCLHEDDDKSTPKLRENSVSGDKQLFVKPQGYQKRTVPARIWPPSLLPVQSSPPPPEEIRARQKARSRRRRSSPDTPSEWPVVKSVTLKKFYEGDYKFWTPWLSKPVYRVWHDDLSSKRSGKPAAEPQPSSGCLQELIAKEGLLRAIRVKERELRENQRRLADLEAKLLASKMDCDSADGDGQTDTEMTSEEEEDDGGEGGSEQQDYEKMDEDESQQDDLEMVVDGEELEQEDWDMIDWDPDMHMEWESFLMDMNHSIEV